MNRRGFLKALGIGLPVAAVGKKLIAAEKPVTNYPWVGCDCEKPIPRTSDDTDYIQMHIDQGKIIPTGIYHIYKDLHVVDKSIYCHSSTFYMHNGTSFVFDNTSGFFVDNIVVGVK